MGKIAFVFAGQGAQYSGMGQSLCEASPAAQAVFDVADKLRPGTSQQCFTAPVEELSLTENTQPASTAWTWPRPRPWRRRAFPRTMWRASPWGRSRPELCRGVRAGAGL